MLHAWLVIDLSNVCSQYIVHLSWFYMSQHLLHTNKQMSLIVGEFHNADGYIKVFFT